MNPPVTGFLFEPSMLTTLPCCTVTDKLQASGQSSGHAVSTTETGPRRIGPAALAGLVLAGVAITYDTPADASSRRDCWRRIRRARRGTQLERCSGARHAARSSQPSRLSAAAVPSSDRRAVAGRH